MSAFAIALDESPAEAIAAIPPCSANAEVELLIGTEKVRRSMATIQELRRRAGQGDDLTTDPHYFLTTNASRDRRVIAALIRRNQEVEACVFFFEHCWFGMGLGLCRGGDGVGAGLVAGGVAAFRVHYIQLATQALLQHWRIHGVSLAVLEPLEDCMAVLGEVEAHHCFAGRTVAHDLVLKRTYREMLEGLGPRTRRSLSAKREQLERTQRVAFVPWLPPDEALEAMLSLRRKAEPRRERGFYQARLALLRARPAFFCMGLRLPDGSWLSVVSGWRDGSTTYVDLQLNHSGYKKESLSAVMRSYLLEYEISFQRSCIRFVGGTSLLLRRYCSPAVPSTYAFLWRSCVRADLFRWIVPRLQKNSVYERFGKQAFGERTGLLRNLRLHFVGSSPRVP